MAEMPPIELMAEIIVKDTEHLSMLFEFTEVTEHPNIPKRYWRTVSFDSEAMRDPFMSLRLGHEATVEIKDEGEPYKLYFEKLSFVMWLSDIQLSEGPLE